MSCEKPKKPKADECCVIDNHAVAFEVDKPNERVTLTLKSGVKFHITADELRDLLGAVTAAPTDDVKVVRLYINSERKPVAVLSDGTEVVSDDAVPAGGGADDYVVSSELSFLTDFPRLVFTRKSGEQFSVDLSAIARPAPSLDTPYYVINEQGDKYTLTAEDFNNRTIVSMVGATGSALTLEALDNSKIGYATTITMTAGDLGAVINLVKGAGVTITPEDVFPLRRVGSSVTLVYRGDGKYMAFGELP